MKKIIFIFFLFISFLSFSQKDSIFHIPEFENSSKTKVLDSYWKYHAGDDLNWAKPVFNDSTWGFSNTDFSSTDITNLKFEGIAWYRLHLYVSEKQKNKSYALLINQNGASEIYLDGKLIQTYGKPSSNKSEEIKYDPNDKPFVIQFDSAGEHVIAVRYSNHTAQKMFKNYFQDDAGFTITIANANDAIENELEDSVALYIIFSFLFTFFITIAFLHFLLFLFYRSQKSNLTYSFFIFLFSLFFLLPITSKNVSDPDTANLIAYITLFVIPIFFTALWAFINSLFYEKQTKAFWVISAILLIILILKYLAIEPGIISFIYVCMVTIISTVEVVRAIIKKKKGAWAIGLAAMCFLTLILILLLKNALGLGTGFSIEGDTAFGILLIILLVITILGIPVSMSFYLAREFAQTSKSLSKKLIEVKELSIKNMEQEKEKQKILESQKENLEIQVAERTFEIVEQKKLIEEKNKDITDSINYAKRIQEAMLPESNLLEYLFSDSFILYKPKDIVSGDFYWFAEQDGKKIIAVADCTGHGVPGALMSMIGSNILNKLVVEKGITKPSEILNLLNDEIRIALKQKDNTSETRDGMDIVIICIFGSVLEYAGAHRPLYLIKNEKLEEIKANKFSIGGVQQEENRIFQNHIVTLQKGDKIYLSSDGFADQFGGSTGKKLMTKNFKELLLKIQNQKMQTQKQELHTTIEEWKGSREQVDDILVIGIGI